jgi:predicted secreted Zn-dependent protease
MIRDHFLKIALTPLFLALPLPALALEKCYQADGKVVIADRCPVGTTRTPPPVQVIVIPAPALPGTAEAPIVYYDVQGTDIASLLAALNARSTHGQTAWKLGYDYRTRFDKVRCSIESLSTKLELSMTLPRWSPPPGTAPELVARWERYVAALKEHENGHLEHARDLERAIRPALLAVPPAPDCDALDAAVRARYNELFDQVKARDAEYDARTRDGAEQGAVFP